MEEKVYVSLRPAVRETLRAHMRAQDNHGSDNQTPVSLPEPIYQDLHGGQEQRPVPLDDVKMYINQINTEIQKYKRDYQASIWCSYLSFSHVTHLLPNRDGNLPVWHPIGCNDAILILAGSRPDLAWNDIGVEGLGNRVGVQGSVWVRVQGSVRVRVQGGGAGGCGGLGGWWWWRSKGGWVVGRWVQGVVGVKGVVEVGAAGGGGVVLSKAWGL